MNQQDLAILTAVHGAFAVCENQFWMCGGDEPGEELAKRAPAIVAELARFVRTYPDAPPEALWNVARGVGALVSWEQLSPETQYAFDIFGTVLRHVDATAAKAAIAEECAAPQQQLWPPDVEGTPLEQVSGILDPTR
jgi:hypothetical protein